MKRLLIPFLALALCPPAQAGTWVTYFETAPWQSSDNKRREFKIDVQSIARHKGWVYANSRICLDGFDCGNPFDIGAQCKEQKFRGMGALIYTRRNGNEWWARWQINEGTRKWSYLPPEEQSKSLATQRGIDKRHTAAFNFLCDQ